MECAELKVSVNTLNGSPLITVTGKTDVWYAQALEDVISGLPISTRALTLDISSASFPEVESLSTLIRMLRIVSGELRVAVIAGGSTVSMLRLAGLEPRVVFCMSHEQAADVVRVKPEYLTSRRMAKTSRVRELPLAA